MRTTSAWTMVLLICFVAPTPGSAQAARAASARVIWRTAGDGSAISPRGDVVAYIDWDTGDVAAYDVAGGRTRLLTNNDAWSSNNGWAEGPLVFAPGGDRLALGFSNPRGGDPYRFELRMISPGDTLQHVLDTLPPDAPGLAALDWHATLGILYAVTWGDLSSELRLIDPDQRIPRTVIRRPAGSGTPRSGLISPDGSTIAYVADGRLFTIRADGTGYAAHPFEAEVLLGWHSDGTALLLHATRGGVTGNWSVATSDGAPAGDPVLLHRTAMGVVAGGRSATGVHFVEHVESPRLVAATIDPSRAMALTGPSALTVSPDGAAGHPSWSPDGARLAYTVRVPNRPIYRVMIAGADGAGARELTRITDHDLITGLAWSADGRSLVIAGRGQSRGTAWIGRVDVVTGDIRRLVMQPALAVATTPAGGVVYVQAAAAGDTTVHVMVLDDDDAAPRPLATFPVREYPRAISVSPDGKLLSVIRPVANRTASVLQLLSASNGDSLVLAKLERPNAFDLNLGTIPWTADGKYLLVVARSDGQARFHVVDVVTGLVRSLPIGPRQISRTHPALNPDDRRLVYVDGTPRAELKVIPLDTTARIP